MRDPMRPTAVIVGHAVLIRLHAHLCERLGSRPADERGLVARCLLVRPAFKMRACVRPHVLVLDEVGYQPPARDEANLVFQMIWKRYEKGSIPPTSNKAFSEWVRCSETRSWPPPSSTGS
ncbi:ATP-binding protein [Actinoallomurus acaciae]|uniref:ATP-binding protein n=1 Tax=Actinoallomurus acaciae TaxID=502577 RepID=A0ABV5Y6T7_9ACTN